MTRCWLWAACPILLLPALVSAVDLTGNKEQQAVRVIINAKMSGTIRLEAKRAPLARVFDELARETGARIHYSASPDELASATCEGVTVHDVVKCLVGGEANLVFRDPKKSSPARAQAEPLEIWILETSSRAGRVAAGTAHGTATATAKKAVREAAMSGEKAAPQTDPNKTGNLGGMSSAEASAQRVEGLSRLAAEGNADDESVWRALENALSDQDPSARAQAVYGLSRLRGAGAVGVLQDALQDGDASVRLMAVDSAGSDARSLGLLTQALADSDETVRAFAAMRLAALSNARSAR